MWVLVGFIILCENTNCAFQISVHKIKFKFNVDINLTLILLFTTTPTFANKVDPDKMASDLIRIYTFFHSVCEFERKHYMMFSDWLIVRNGCGYFNYSAG